MSVVIRLKRVGRRNFPSYRISVADPYRPINGRTMEQLGAYDPAHPNPALRERVDVERARHWIAVGARASDTVRSIFARAGVYKGLPKKTKKARVGRTQDTAKAKARIAAKDVRSKRKAERQSTRRATKRAAAKAGAEKPA
jgi:small subunit ribosomal protein S16